MAAWPVGPPRSQSTSAIRIRWLRRSPRTRGNADGSNRSCRDRGEVAGGGEGDLRETGPERFTRRNGGAGAGAVGDGSGGREPIGAVRGDLGKFYDREVHRQTWRGAASCLSPGAGSAGGRRAAEERRRAPGLGGDQNWRGRGQIGF